MSQLSDAADLALQWAEKQQAILEIAKALKSIGSIEQATEERQKALVTATAEHEAMKANVEQATEALAALLAEHSREVGAHQTAVAEMRDKAATDADAIRALACADADAAVEAADAEVQRIQAAHAETMATLNTQLAALREEVSAAQTDLATAKAERDAVKSATDAMRQAARAVAG